MTTSQVQSREHIVLIGNGMVGYKLCAKLREQDPERRLRITVFGEEPRPAYDRVQLTTYFKEGSADPLILSDARWYADQGIELRLSEKVTEIDRKSKSVHTDKGVEVPYDKLVLCTGSAAFVPPLPGVEKEGVFVYRTIEDLDAIMAYAKRSKTCAVIGGGLLGLEAARAVQECGLTAHVVEMAPRLMPRQIDDVGGSLLKRSIVKMGVECHLGKLTREIAGPGKVEALVFDGDEQLDVDMIVISAGIKPRDELARLCDLEVGIRGGVVVDDKLQTSDPNIYAVGEVALHRSMIYGLVAPGYEMAEVVAKNLTGKSAQFTGADLSAKLKLMGVDVASFGDPFCDGEATNTVAYQDFVKGVYKKLIVSADGKTLLGGMLVGDASEYGQLVHYARSGDPLPGSPEGMIGIGEAAMEGGLAALPEGAQICSCEDVSKGAILQAVEGGCTSAGEVKKCTGAGSGCGGCMPQVTDLVAIGLKAMGVVLKPRLCEHFDFTRQEMFDLIRIKGITSFEELVKNHGSGLGCEICKPVAASIFASVYNDMILKQHDTLQDTNDRFLANIQRTGLYSVVPRVPGGELTPDQLIALGMVAKKYNLYSKITGGQRVDLFGAHVGDLPSIWEELIAAGFESGHAYAKGLRTVKSCVGTTWCRYGVQDSVGLAIRIEHRYKGIRSPHKLKGAVSGCIRECAEAQSKDFGIICTEKGYNLYVCGNGGSKPRHADLIATDVDEETLIKYIDRFLMYYIRTADKLTRTSVWADKIEGGIEHIKDVVVNDSLGLAAELEAMAQHLVDTYQCEWKTVVETPELRAKFTHYTNSAEHDATVQLVEQRDQRRPRDWAPGAMPQPESVKRSLPVISAQWTPAGTVSQYPKNAGMTMKHGNTQIAVFNLDGGWYATQNMCPHKQDMVLSRGLLGDQGGVPKVACPMHKKTFSLVDGTCLTGEDYKVRTFPVRVDGDQVLVELPDAAMLETELCPSHCDHADAAE